MAVLKALIAALCLAGVIGAGAFAYDVVRPRTHPGEPSDVERPAPAATAPTVAAQVSAPSTDLFGKASVVDGDTLLVQDVEVDLWTIDAPELAQTCDDESGKPWACGEVSRVNLEKLIDDHQVACRAKGTLPEDGRWQGLCFVADAPCQDKAAPCAADLGSLNLAQVTEGWAVDVEGQYMDNQADARDRKAGIWTGRFELPWAWRKRAEQGS